MNVEQKLKEYTLALEDLNKQLKELEIEKEILKESYNSSSDKEKAAIAIMMKESEEKFKKLCDETLKLSLKVKNLKKQC